MSDIKVVCTPIDCSQWNSAFSYAAFMGFLIRLIEWEMSSFSWCSVSLYTVSIEYNNFQYLEHNAIIRNYYFFFLFFSYRSCFERKD